MDALVSPPTSAMVGDSVSITSKLTFAGVPVAGKTVIVSIGDMTQVGTTGADGSVTVTLPVGVAPVPRSLELSAAKPRLCSRSPSASQ